MANYYRTQFGSVSDEMLAKQKPWDPAQPLPKPTEELSRIAVDSHVPTATQPKSGWSVSRMMFYQVPEGLWPGLKSHDPATFKDKWYCRIDIAAYGDYRGEWRKNFAVVNVFLDGTIIQPQQSTDSSRH